MAQFATMGAPGMKETIRCVIVGVGLFVLSVPILTAQTESQIEQHYPRLKTYAVRPDLTLTAKYASDGQVCEMVFEPRHWDGEKVLLISTLQEDPINVVEEVVPLNERGPRQKDESEGTSFVGGGVISRRIHYEKITVDVAGSSQGKDWGGIMVALVKWRTRSCSR
jgi:hypothetical protein